LKPVVAFDIDGTMGDYHQHFLEFATKYLGRPSIEPWLYSGHENFSSWFCRTWQTDYRTWQDIKLAYRQGGQKRSMPPFVGMIEAARSAHRRDCEVWVTTTRPYQRLDGIDPDTREWLRRNRVPYEGLIYSEDKYRDLAGRIDPARVIAVFDDQIDMIDQASEVFRPEVPFLCKSWWNRNVFCRQRSGNAQQAISYLHQQLSTWRSVHEERQVQSV
jgi:hypothetical protein